MPIDICRAIAEMNPQDVDAWIAEIKENPTLINQACFGPRKNQTLLEIAILAVESSPKPAINAVQIINMLLENGANAKGVASNILKFPLLTFAVANIKDEEACMAVCNSLLDKEAEIDKKERNGNTALAIACYLGSFRVATLLMERGASLASRNLDGASILEAACCSAKPDVMFIGNLLENQEVKLRDLNPKSARFGTTPLFRAATSGNMDVIKLLVENGADPKAVNAEGAGVLHYLSIVSKNVTVPVVVNGGNLEAARYFISLGVDYKLKSTTGFTPLLVACNSGFVDLAKYLYELEPQAYHEDNTDRERLAANISTNLKLLEFFVEKKGINIFENEHTLVLEYAANNKNRNKESFEYLLGLYWTNLTKLNSEGKLSAEQVDQMLKAKFDQLLFICVAAKLNNNPELAEVLTSRGADNYVDEKTGKSTLHYACRRKYNEVVKYLLEKKCDPNQRDNAGFTPMYIAKQSANTIAVELLSGAGVPPLNLEAENLIIAQRIAQRSQNGDGYPLLFPDITSSMALGKIWDLPPHLIPLSQDPPPLIHLSQHPLDHQSHNLNATKSLNGKRPTVPGGDDEPPGAIPRVEEANPIEKPNQNNLGHN